MNVNGAILRPRKSVRTGSTLNTTATTGGISIPAWYPRRSQVRLAHVKFNGDSDAGESGFVEREATPEPAMRLGIRSHLAGVSLSNTVFLLE